MQERERSPGQEGIGRWNLLIRVYRKLVINIKTERYTENCFGGNRHLYDAAARGQCPMRDMRQHVGKVVRSPYSPPNQDNPNPIFFNWRGVRIYHFWTKQYKQNGGGMVFILPPLLWVRAFIRTNNKPHEIRKPEANRRILLLIKLWYNN